MNAPVKISKLQVLRERDGDRCWLCNDLLQFDAARNSAMAPSIEHLVARKLGGPECDANLVLCHIKCNRILGCRPVADKIKLRERRRRKLRLAAFRPPKRIKPISSPIPLAPSKRLKGLDEFETPAFVGRMARIERRQRLTWLAMLAGVVAIGAGIGLVAF